MKRQPRPTAVRHADFLVYLIIWALALLTLAQDADAADAPGFGQLTIAHAGQQIELPAQATSVSLTVTGPLIDAVVRQEFTNPTADVIEAIYVFPLPENATVHAMEMVIGERRIVSVVQEKQQARRTYDQARRQGKRAALVESQRPNLFTTSVANIGPHETVSVRLEYLDQADFAAGWFSLVLPLTFTPRYYPPALLGGEGHDITAARADAASVQPPFAPAGAADFPTAQIDVQLDPGVKLADLRSDSHTITTAHTGRQWRVELLPTVVAADRDFLLAWRPAAAPLAQPALFVEDRPEGRYALLMIVPADDGAAPAPPTETVFVIDVSGSMDGPSIVQAKAALLRAVQQLRPGDRFNILAFNNHCWMLAEQFLDSDAAAIDRARSWVKKLHAYNGTEMHPALLRAQTAFLTSAGGTHARRIILLTDASVGNEDQLLRETIAGLGDVRLHVVGIGMAPNRYLVRRLAGEGGGLNTFVSGHLNDVDTLNGFLARIARPQLVDAHLEWPDAPTVSGYPRRLGEVFGGELTLWSGRFPVGADVGGALEARHGGRDISLALPRLDVGRDTPGVATRWAGLKVDDLMAAMQTGRESDALRNEIVETGLAFGLVTRFTSRVAVEETVSTSDPATTHRLRNGLPAGSRLLGELPRGGTLDDLWRGLGLALLLSGAGLWLVRRGVVARNRS